MSAHRIRDDLDAPPDLTEREALSSGPMNLPDLAGRTRPADPASIERSGDLDDRENGVGDYGQPSLGRHPLLPPPERSLVDPDELSELLPGKSLCLAGHAESLPEWTRYTEAFLARVRARRPHVRGAMIRACHGDAGDPSRVPGPTAGAFSLFRRARGCYVGSVASASAIREGGCMDFRKLGTGLAAACVLAACATLAGAATVVDGTLQIRGVGRPSGRQAATVRLSITPPPSKRTTVAASFTVGGTSVPLTATVSRTGRVFARAQRLALAAELPDIASARIDLGPPVDVSAAFAPADCVARARGRRLDCPALTSPLEPPADGVYDAAVDLVIGGDHLALPPAVALVTTALDGSPQLAIFLDPFDSLMLAGTSDDSTLTGYAVSGGDILATASGSATALREPGASRFDGVASAPAFGQTWAFTLRRPDAGTPSASGGAWTVTFDGDLSMPFTGTVTLDLAVADDGHATTGPTTFTSGPPYVANAGTCLVAPGGALSCWIPVPELYGIVLQGTLDVAAGTATGTFYAGTPPVIYAEGTWTASR